MTTVRILDLTVAQVERIERATGVPVGSWQKAPSQADLFAVIYSEATGTDLEAVKGMTLRELVAAVDLGDDADPS